MSTCFCPHTMFLNGGDVPSCAVAIIGSRWPKKTIFNNSSSFFPFLIPRVLLLTRKGLKSQSEQVDGLGNTFSWNSSQPLFSSNDVLLRQKFQEFFPNQFELFQIIPKSVSKPIREKKFSISFVEFLYETFARVSF